MTQATNTTLGEIRLAGDLAGGNDALLPTLTTVNATPGTFTVPVLTVDTKGRITAIANGTPPNLGALIPDASTTTKGVVRIGTNVSITDTTTKAYHQVNFNGTLTGASPTGFTSDDAIYTFTLIRDTVSMPVSVTGSSAQTITQLITQVNADIAPAAMTLESGNLRISSGTSGVAGSISITADDLFEFVDGFVSFDVAVPGMGDAAIYVPNVSTGVLGIASFNTTQFNVSSGAVSLKPLPDATYTTKGVVQIQSGGGIAVTNGIISTTAIPDASTTVKGIVQISDNSGIDVTAGVISLRTATNAVKGVVQIGANLSVTGGVVTTSFGNATNVAYGLVRIGNNINVADGEISIPLASASVAGVAKVGDGLILTGDTISALPVPDATLSTKGIIQVGSGLTVNTGVLSVAFPTASTSQLGIVQIATPTLLSINGSGLLSSAVPNASTSIKGIVNVPAGSNITVSNGALSLSGIPNATDVTPGLVTIGSGISVSDGVISISLPNATTTSKGAVQIDNTKGLAVTAGVLSTAPATNSTMGVVTTADPGVITISNGVMSLGTQVVRLNVQNTFTAAQVVALVSPSFSASITPNFALSNVFFYTATSNFTLNAPTNVVAGGTYIVIIRQDSVGGRACVFNSAYKFGTGAITSLSVIENTYDVISIVAQSPSVLLCTTQIGYR